MKELGKWIFTPPVLYYLVIFLFLALILIIWDLISLFIYGNTFDLNGFRTQLHVTILEILFLFVLISIFDIRGRLKNVKKKFK